MKQKKKVKKPKIKNIPDNFLRQLGQHKQMGNPQSFRATKIHMPRRPK
jgi:hypothetical protein